MVFGVLRDALRGVVDRVKYRELKESELRPVLEDLTLELVSADVALEVAEGLTARLLKELTGTRVERGASAEEVVKGALKRVIVEMLPKPPDIVSMASARCGSGSPLKVVFFGINGVGKTTTIAKVAHMLRKAGISVAIAAADTYRAGAQEQLEIHAKRVGVPIIKGRYGSDPASVAHDAIEHARARGICVVLIDTAGRMHVDVDLMEEMKKIVRVSKPDLKILIVDALTGNDAVEQARRFHEEIGMDGFIVTKADADSKGGAVLSVSAATGRPILFLGVGQGYDDLAPFSPESYVSSLLD